MISVVMSSMKGSTGGGRFGTKRLNVVEAVRGCATLTGGACGAAPRVRRGCQSSAATAAVRTVRPKA